ncbi:MAG: hypothetical protein A2V70_16105 [Planctomycetes bacterium RBG_13_63_9]|nr:MAG: hypothetical protein A2V70_16105 [Planctomycetes bacterium RBG_13_63_9]
MQIVAAEPDSNSIQVMLSAAREEKPEADQTNDRREEEVERGGCRNWELLDTLSNAAEVSKLETTGSWSIEERVKDLEKELLTCGVGILQGNVKPPVSYVGRVADSAEEISIHPIWHDCRCQIAPCPVKTPGQGDRCKSVRRFFSKCSFSTCTS